MNPYFAVLLAATICGFNGILIRYINLSPTSLTFFRTFVPTIIFLVYLLWNKVALFHSGHKILLYASTLNAIRLLLYFIGFQYTTISAMTILTFTWPVFATLFSALYLKEHISKYSASLIALAFIGLVVMYGHEDLYTDMRGLWGGTLIVLAALMYAITAIIFQKELQTRSIPESIFYQNVVGAIIFLPAIFFQIPYPTLTQFSLATVYGILVGVISFVLFFYALRRLKISHFSLLTYWEVPAAIIFASIFMHEKLTIHMLIGGAMIIISGLLLRKEIGTKPAMSPKNSISS